MKKNINIAIDQNKLAEFARLIPREDFINEQFDLNSGKELTDILFILSTPRSGSTLFSELIYKNSICIPHEYFQTAQYLPLLASRWGCIDAQKLNKTLYMEKLIQHRTSAKGWLGINLHGKHLNTFTKLLTLLPDARKHYVHIMRQDEISQAVSYEIATQTKKWSSHFDEFKTAKYSYEGICKKLESIQKQNLLIKTFLNTQGIQSNTVYYEELAANPKKILEKVLPCQLLKSIVVETNLTKQSSSKNNEWVNRFSAQYLANELNDNKTSKRPSRPKSFRSLLRNS